MNKHEANIQKTKDEMNKHFQREQRTAKARARRMLKDPVDRLQDQIKQTRLDDVVRDCDFNPESTSFRIS